jgi:hypothetical protein
MQRHLILVLFALVLAVSAAADPRWWQHDRALTSGASAKYAPDVSYVPRMGPGNGGLFVTYEVEDPATMDRDLWLLASLDGGCNWCDAVPWAADPDLSETDPHVAAAILRSGLLTIQVIYVKDDQIWVNYVTGLLTGQTPEGFCADLAAATPGTVGVSRDQTSGNVMDRDPSITVATDATDIAQFHAAWSRMDLRGPFPEFTIEYSSNLMGDGNWITPGRDLSAEFGDDGLVPVITSDALAATVGQTSVSIFYRRNSNADVAMTRSNQRGLVGTWSPFTVVSSVTSTVLPMGADSSSGTRGEESVWNAVAWIDRNSGSVNFDGAFWEGMPGSVPSLDFDAAADAQVTPDNSLQPELSVGVPDASVADLFVLWQHAGDSGPSEIYSRGGVLDPDAAEPRDLDTFPIPPGRSIPPDPTISLPEQLTFCQWDESTGVCTPMDRDAAAAGAVSVAAADGPGVDLPSTHAVVFADDRDGTSQIYLKLTDGSLATPTLVDALAGCEGVTAAQVDLSFNLLDECPSPLPYPEYIDRYLVYYGTQGLGGPFAGRVELDNVGLTDPVSIQIGGLEQSVTYDFVLIAEDEARNIRPADFDPDSSANTVAPLQTISVDTPQCSPLLVLNRCEFIEAVCDGQPDPVANPGDTVVLELELENLGPGDVIDLAGTVVATGGSVITPASGDLSSLNIGLGVGESTVFTVEVELDTECPTPPDPTLVIKDVISGGSVGLPDLSCQQPVVTVDCSETCDSSPECSPGNLILRNGLKGVKQAPDAALAVFSWETEPVDEATEYHLNAVADKRDLAAPGPYRAPAGVGMARCEAIPPDVLCTDPSPIASAPEMLFYQVVSACGPDGDQEGPL